MQLVHFHAHSTQFPEANVIFYWNRCLLPQTDRGRVIRHYTNNSNNDYDNNDKNYTSVFQDLGGEKNRCTHTK